MSYLETILDNGYSSVRDFFKAVVRVKDPHGRFVLGNYVFYYQKDVHIYSLHYFAKTCTICIDTTTRIY